MLFFLPFGLSFLQSCKDLLGGVFLMQDKIKKIIYADLMFLFAVRKKKKKGVKYPGRSRAV